MEKKYFRAIKSAIERSTALIQKRIIFLNRNQIYWKEALKLDNTIQKGVQEIVRAIIFRAFNDWEPFCLPICSDTSFETENAIINLDIKTVKDIDNDAK